MDLEKFGIGLVGYLEKLKTKRQVKSDIKTLDEINIPLVGKLNKTRTNAQLKEDIKSVKATVNLTAKTSKKGLSTSVKDIVKQAQEVANKNNIKLNIGGIDNKKLDDIIAKLKRLSQSSNTLDTSESVNAINREAQAMLEIIDNARKAALEKLEFAEANREVRESAENTADAIVRERNAMESMNDINYILANVNMNAQQGESVFRRFGNTLNEAFATYTVANLLEDAIYEIIDAGKEGIEVVKELNDVATSLRMATGGSLEETNALVNSYNDLGQELGAITSDVSESADAWLRQGHSIADTNTLIADSMMLSKIANLKSAESTEYLTSIMQAYKLSAEEVVDIVSKLSAVDLESASDAGGLAKSLSRCASAAEMAGVSMDTLIGYISTVKEVTQDSDEAVGNMFKSVFSRMNQIRANKFVDLETGESLNDTEKVLNKIGIVTRDLNNQLIDSEQILDSIGKSWNEYDSNTQKALATAVAGTYQYNKFIALMQSYGDAINYANISAGSKGTAEEKFSYYLESLESKTNALQASLENLAMTTFSDELYASVLDTSKAVVDLIADTGVLKGLLIGLGASGSLYGFQQITHSLGDIMQGFANLNEAMNMSRSGFITTDDDMQTLIDLTGGLSQSQTRLLLSTNNLTDAQKITILMNQGLTQAEAQQMIQTWGVATAQNGATVATVTLTNSLRGLWMTLMANPLILVTTLVSAGVMAFDVYNRKIEETKQQFADLKSEVSQIESKLSSLNTELQTTVDRMNELESKDTLTFTEKEEYDNLVKQNNELQRSIDLLELEQKTKNKELNKAFVDTMVSDTQDQFEYTKDDVGNVFEGNSAFYNMSGGSFSASDEKEFIERQFALHKEYSEKLTQLNKETTSATDERNAEIAKEIQTLESSIEEIETYLSSKNIEFSTNASEIHYISNPTTEDDKVVNAWLDYIADFQDRMAIAMGGANAKENAFNRLVDNWQFDKILQGLQDLGEQGKVTADMLNDSKYDEFIVKLVELGVIDTADNLEDVALAFNNFTDSTQQASDAVSNFEDEVSSLETLNQSINTTFDSIQKSFSALREFKNAMSNGMTDSALDVVAGLSDELKALVAEFYAGTVSADELFQALTEHYDNDLNNYSNAIIGKNQYSEDFYNKVGLNDTEFVNHMLDNYGVDISNCKTYAEAKLKIEQGLLGELSTMWSKYYDSQNIVYDSSLHSLDAEINALEQKKSLGGIGGDFSNSFSAFDETQLTLLKNLREELAGRGEKYEAAIEVLNDIVYNGIESSFEGIGNEVSNNSAKGTEKVTTQVIDHIETLISRVKRSISNLGKTVSATYLVWETRNDALLNQMAQTNKEIVVQQKAYERYMYEANKVGLSDYYKRLVQNGALDISTIADETLKKQIETYSTFYEKAISCSDAILELKDSLAELAKVKIDNIIAESENDISLIENRIAMFEAYIERMELEGYSISAKASQLLLESNKEQLPILEKQYKEMSDALQKSIDAGIIAIESDAWYEAVNKIDDVKLSIEETTNTIIELENQLRELSWENFDKGQQYISNLNDEFDFLLELISKKKMHDDNGITEFGQTAMGLHAFRHNTFMSQADDYKKAIAELDAEFANDSLNEDYLERRQELVKLQREMIISAQDEVDAMISLKKEGFDFLLDSLNSAIEKYNKLNDSQKDLYDYQKNIAKQTKEISSLEKQLLAYQGDDSESSRSIVQKLKVSLEEAKTELEETEMDKNIKDRQELLTKLRDDVQQWISSRMDDEQQLLKEVIQATNDNASSISSTISSSTDEVGYKISSELSSVLYSNGDLVSEYNENFTSTMTTLQSSIDSIKNFVEQMAKNANSNFNSMNDHEDTADAMSTKSDGWSNNNGSWSYTKDGKTVKNEWVKDNGKYYHLNDSGVMDTNTWLKDGKDWRYVDGTGAAATGWQKLNWNGKEDWYAFDDKGKMKANEWVDDYFVGEGGQMLTHTWVGHDGVYYYVGDDGKWLNLPGWTSHTKPNDGYPIYEYAKGSRRIPFDQLARVGEEGQELQYDKSEGELRVLGKEDMVFNNDQTKFLYDFSKDGLVKLSDMKNVPWDFASLPLPQLNLPTMDYSKLPQPQVIQSQPNIGDVNITFDLPNVKSTDDFINDLIRDNRFEKAIQTMVFEPALGKGTLGKYRYLRPGK